MNRKPSVGAFRGVVAVVLATGALVAGLLVLGPAGAAAQTRNATPTVLPLQSYVHPTLGYSLSLPLRSTLHKQSQGDRVLIQSPRGYTISIQAGAVQSSVTLTQRIDKLERRDLGPGKRWNRRLGSRETTVNGLPAFEALYTGVNEAARVTIVRGPRFDYVFIYLTAPTAYANSLGEYFAVMTSFKPAGTPRARQATPPPSNPPPAAAPPPPAAVPQVQTAAAPKPAAPPPGTGRVRLFAAPGFGLSVTYPEAWIAEKTSPYSALFSGANGSEAYYATVRVNRVSLAAQGDNRTALANVFADQKKQINKGTRNPVFFSEAPYRYERSGVRLNGHETVVAFSYRRQRFRRWMVVLPHPAGGEAMVMTYTAPDSTFDRYQPVAAKMMKSLVFADPRLASRK